MDPAVLPLLHTALIVLGTVAVLLAMLGDAWDALAFGVLGVGAALLDR